MADVIQFPGSGSEKTAMKAANEASSRAHGAAISSVLKNAPRMNEADRRRVAENLWVILAEAEQRGIS